MAKVVLAFCIYAENPYGDPDLLAKEKPYCSVLDAAVNVGEQLNQCFGNTPRTYFCTGSHLEALELRAGKETVKKIYAPGSAEVANHSYSHAAIAKVKGADELYPRKILTPAQITSELKLTNDILTRVFKRKGPFGFSAPCGFSQPLLPSITQAIANAGCHYSNSWTRGPRGSYFSKITDTSGTKSALRQPLRYANGLVEIPLSGWQDVFNFPTWFNMFHGVLFGKRFPRKEKDILAWWDAFLEEAITVSEQHHKTIALTYMLHPAYLVGIPFIDRWKKEHITKGYDPHLHVLAQQLDKAKASGIRITTAGEIAAQYRKKQK